ncbi:MAG: hypothetical protein ABI600_12830, partial [Luteolibacter sp.]
NDELRSTIVAIREMQELAQATLDSLSPTRDHRLAQLRSSLVKLSNVLGYDAVRYDPRRDGVNRVHDGDPRHGQALIDWASRPFS